MFAGTSVTENPNMAVNRKVVALVMTSPSDENRCDTGLIRNCAMVQSNESRRQDKKHHAEARRRRRHGDDRVLRASFVSQRLRVSVFAWSFPVARLAPCSPEVSSGGEA